MNCTAVREALPEFALGVAPSAETRRVELHVETCAACRKEAIDLQRAVAAFGYALAPAEDSDAELESSVVSAVQAEVAAPAAHRHRHSRRSAFAVLAAAILVFALGDALFGIPSRSTIVVVALDASQLGEVAGGRVFRHGGSAYPLEEGRSLPNGFSIMIRAMPFLG